MGHRPPDLRDGTLQDIQHICSSMEQLFLSYRTGEVPYIYIANLLELLFQSARTRICVLRQPVLESDDAFSVEELDKLVVFATFRKQEIYRAFLEQLSSRLHKYGEEFLERECERPEDGNDYFYICLARVYPEDQVVVIGRYRSKEAYHRLTTLLRLLTEESKTWGLDIPAELYNCFSLVPDKQNSICKLSTPSKSNTAILPNEQDYSDQSSRNELNESLLEPIERWVDYIYQQNHGMPLARVALPGQPEQDTGFSNLFFFIRINDIKEGQDCPDDSFRVRLFCPPQQRRELSRFFHLHREQACYWLAEGGECKISGMGKCLFKEYWSGLPESVTDDARLEEHYAPLWEQLMEASNSDYSKSEMAFRSSSIVFDRRQQRTLEGGGKGVVSGATKRDRISACITFRMVAPADQSDTSADSKVPQIMYVPIYAGAAPFVLAATVVNAQLPEPLHSTLSEWRRSYRFADMVFQFMASRLKESARKAYLNSATNLVQAVYEAYRSTVEKPSCCDIEAEDRFLADANAGLDDLSKIYPYHKIVLAKATKSVIERQGREVFETPERIVLHISLEPNPYWRSFSDKPFFSAEHVSRKFCSGIARSVALSEKERREWQDFFSWHREKFKRSPFSKNGWREYAAKVGWTSNSDVGSTPSDEAGDPSEKNNVIRFKK